jgi:glucose/arabinose dehydrogenase
MGLNMRAYLLLAVCLSFFRSTVAVAEPPTTTLTPAFGEERFVAPLGFEIAPGGDAIFIVEQGGRIFRLTKTPNGIDRRLFLDLSSKVINRGERGLLGLAFHPRFAVNGNLFVHYSKAPSGDTVIARYRVGPDSLGDPKSEEKILEVVQPFPNHNGGQIRFGPDGYLYIGLGDGGSAGDPGNRAQDRSNLLGKILRIDVDRTSRGSSYGIPTDNPFNAPGERPEIFALGLRNPWRFSFDRASGDLWVADVGQNGWEEIDRLKKGGNYGWNVVEGEACFKPRFLCGKERYDAPVHVYPHSQGASVTGGFVYRGATKPELLGRYIYGDFVSGKIWALTLDGKQNVELLDTALNISSFGEDAAGEIYVLSYSDGGVYKLSRADEAGREPR